MDIALDYHRKSTNAAIASFSSPSSAETNSHVLNVRNPYDMALIEQLHCMDTADVDDAIDKVCTYDYSLCAWERYEILSSLCALLEIHRAELQQLISLESGKTLRDSGIEIERAIQAFLLSAEEAKRINGEAIPLDAVKGQSHGYAYVVREAVGPVAAITPFNYPLNLVAHKVGPALAANNPVLLKPSEHTPLTALKLRDLLHQAGLPENMLQVLIGEPQTIVRTLASHQRVCKISFTGSVEVGRSICSMAGMKHISMELGGNDPMIILDDADLETIIPIAVDGAFGNNGQRCTSVKRFMVQSSIAEDFVNAFVEATKKLKTGDQLYDDTDVGPLITVAAAETIEKRIKAAMEGGATLRHGGKREGALLEPTVLDYVTMDHTLVQQETFGPVAPFIRVESLDEAIAITNQSEFGLQAGVFTNNLALSKRAVSEIQAGAVFINRAPGFRAEHLPFGGVKNSGIGREGIRSAIEAMTQQKTIIM